VRGLERASLCLALFHPEPSRCRAFSLFAGGGVRVRLTAGLTGSTAMETPDGGGAHAHGGLGTSTQGALRRQLRARLLDGMVRKVGGGGAPGASWKVLVVDREALRILAAALGGLNDLANEGVSIVELLDMRREPLPRMPAIFFCAPSAETIQLLASEAPRQYSEFHLFFTRRVPDFQMDVLRQNAQLLRRVKAFVELDVEFLALESRVFSLDRPAASIPQLHAPGLTTREHLDELSVISERLTGACTLVAPEIDWTVRADATSHDARTVATLVKEQLEAAKIQARGDQANRAAAAAAAGTANTWSASDPGAHSSSDAHTHLDHERNNHPHDEFIKPARATLLVLDRTTDLISPLMHEFTYQSMAHDLLKLDYRKPGGVHYELVDTADPSKTKAVLLDDEDSDETWVAARHLFIEEAKAETQARFREFLETDAAYKIRGKEGADVDLRDMSAAVRSLPDSQRKADKHTLHITALAECLKMTGALQLPEVAILEQDIVIGRHADSTRARAEVIIEHLSGLVQNKAIRIEHRIRVVMLAIAVAEGTIALGGEASLLALTSSFKNHLSHSDVLNIPDMGASLVNSVKGFQKILSSARAASDAFAERSRGSKPGGGAEASDGGLGSGLKAKYVERQVLKKKVKEMDSRRRRYRGQDEQLPYDVARYVPPLQGVALDLVDELLALDSFPCIGAVSANSIISSLGNVAVDDDSIHGTGPTTSRNTATGTGAMSKYAAGAFGKLAGRTKSSHARDPADDDRYKVADREHLFVIFFVGGVTYSEIRAVYEICAKREANVLIGGSQVLTPHTFLEICAAVADPVTRMKVMLPPLPIELAQSRAARERTLKEGGAQKAIPNTNSMGAEASTRGGKIRAENTENPAEGRNEADVVVVTEYEKKSMTHRLFGRKKK
jgi:syntaxin-binding protein 1